MESFIGFKDMNLNDRSGLEFVGFQVANSARQVYNQFQREEQEKYQTFFKFMLGLQKFLIPSISKDLLWKEGETITPNKDPINMGVYRFTSALDDMQRESIDKQDRKSITDDGNIRKFLHNIPDMIKKSITPHLTDDMI